MNQYGVPSILALTAKDLRSLQELAFAQANSLEQKRDVPLADVCFRANMASESDSLFNYRLAAVAESSAQMSEQLHAFANNSEAIRLVSGQAHSQPPKIAFLFTGQGSQYLDMGRVLYETHVVFREVIDRCAEYLSADMDYPLREILYSSSINFDSQEGALINQTAYTQPALFAIEYALAKLWQSWGIRPDVVMGHSIGEYVAACIAGVFSLEDGLKLVAARGRLMQSLPQGGAMIAVMDSVEHLETLLQSYGEEVAIAAINGPQNVVVSGCKKAVEEITATLESREIKVTSLAVSHAFHSSLMEPMLAEFAQITAEVCYSSPKIPVVSNLSGKFATEELTTHEYWCRHVRQPVQFAAGMKTLYLNGYELFLEVGPRPILSGMGRQCLPDGFGLWLSSLKPGQGDWQQTLTSLAELYVQGAEVDWQGFNKSYLQQNQANILANPPQKSLLLESLLSQKRSGELGEPIESSENPWIQKLESLPDTEQLTFLRQTLQQIVGEVLAGIHPTGSGTKLQQHIPEDMLNRSFNTIVEWYKYFGIDLKEEVSNLNQGETVLDLCCGYGIGANTLAREFPDLKITGVDLQPDAIQVKKYLSLEQNQNLPATLIAHDACNLSSIATQSISFCYCMAGIAYVPDGLKMLQETYRVLKSGGKAYFYIMRRDDDIAADISLSEIVQAAQGGRFKIHPFSDKTKAGWDSGAIPRPYYEDGVVLEIMKNSEELTFPFNYEGSSNSLQSGKRSMEEYYLVGRYSRYSLSA